MFAHFLSRSAILAVILTAACQLDDSFEGQEIILDIHSDQPLDQLVVYEAESCSYCKVPLTPQMIAKGVLTPAGTMYAFRGGVIELDPATTDYRRYHAEPFGFAGTSLIVVLGYRRGDGDQMVLVAAATVPVAFSGHTFHSSMELTAALVPGIEVWGGAQRCAVVGSNLFVSRGDVDCDGFPTDADCNEAIYCDPAATSPAEKAACQATTCEPCLGVIDGSCSLGTQAVCHDGTGSPRSFTCEVSASCGEPTCLPTAACQLDCVTTRSNDPFGCMLGSWSLSTADPDATNCRIPARASSGASIACEGGSFVEVTLPYTSCASPRLLGGPGLTGENWFLTITPSCRLSLEMHSPYIFEQRDLLVAFESNGLTKTARLSLNAEDGTCGTIGTCNPVPASALCSP